MERAVLNITALFLCLKRIKKQYKGKILLKEILEGKYEKYNYKNRWVGHIR